MKGLQPLADNNAFRLLSLAESETADVVDFRVFEGDPPSPNNDVVLFCPHASSDLKYLNVAPNERFLKYTEHAYDPKALEITLELGEKLQCLVFLGNFSKLVVDPAQSVLAPSVIPSGGVSAPEELGIGGNAHPPGSWIEFSFN